MSTRVTSFFLPLIFFSATMVYRRNLSCVDRIFCSVNEAARAKMNLKKIENRNDSSLKRTLNEAREDQRYQLYCGLIYLQYVTRGRLQRVRREI